MVVCVFALGCNASPPPLFIHWCCVSRKQLALEFDAVPITNGAVFDSKGTGGDDVREVCSQVKSWPKQDPEPSSG